MYSNRALNFVSDGKAVAKWSKHIYKTIKPGQVDYGNDNSKPSVIISPGLSCHVETYSHLINNIIDDVNIVKQPHLARGLGAVTCGKSIKQLSTELLSELELQGIEETNVISHSQGSLVIAYADIMDRERNGTSRFKSHMSISGLLNGSSYLANMPLLSNRFDSVKDYNPNGEIIRKVREQGSVDYGIISRKDEVLLPEEMKSPIIKEEKQLSIGHFDIVLNPLVAEEVASIFKERILRTLLNK